MWHKDQQRYRLDPETGKTYSFSIPRSIKVIGNIHDNPELLDDLASAEKKETIDANSN
ncbi:hypothetical protein SDC9_205663 [bioreactor metagenome]|uniref:Uncharacterized protein n=1 Tax=bioreactor metagenome TaxID=1076179 RepID=A0A645J3J3_9ZZZZ